MPPQVKKSTGAFSIQPVILQNNYYSWTTSEIWKNYIRSILFVIYIYIYTPYNLIIIDISILDISLRITYKLSTVQCVWYNMIIINVVRISHPSEYLIYGVRLAWRKNENSTIRSGIDIGGFFDFLFSLRYVPD